MPVPSWLVYARKHYDKSDDYDLECEVKDAKAVDMEIARLRAALEDVLERHPEEVKILAEHGYDDVKE